MFMRKHTYINKREDLYILGLNCFAHDTSACLVKNGSLLAFTEEERFNRDKHTIAFPKNAIQWCLKEASISLQDVTFVTMSYNPVFTRFEDMGGYQENWNGFI